MPTLPFASTINTVEVALPAVVGVCKAKRGMVEADDVAATVRRAIDDEVVPIAKLSVEEKRAASAVNGVKMMLPPVVGETAVALSVRLLEFNEPPRRLLAWITPPVVMKALVGCTPTPILPFTKRLPVVVAPPLTVRPLADVPAPMVVEARSIIGVVVTPPGNSAEPEQLPACT